jgi:DNA-binding transcriptional LysR family regulator
VLLQHANAYRARQSRQHSTILAPTILPTMLRLFAQLHPRARLNFVVGSEDVLLDKLYAGEIELIIAYNRGPNRTLTTLELYETRMHVILAGDHPLAAAETVPVAALRDEPLILMDIPPSADDILGYFVYRDTGASHR